MTDITARPLEGVRVLDLSRVLAGPTAAQTLADLGADVIKLERPGVGDDTRLMGPHFAGEDVDQVDLVDHVDLVDRSAYFWAVNRGKRSVAVDLAQPDGADLVRGLAAKADVVIENFKVGALERYRLGYADLAAVNRGLVYCSITGFGQTGPYRQRAGYDSIIQAMGGLMSITGEPDGGPQRAGVPMIDIMTGLYASTAILAALRHRDRTGQGQHIDLALLDVMVSSLSYFAVGHLASGRVPQRTGTRNPVTHPSGIYACRDGELMILAGNDEQFRRLCTALGMPELALDPRFGSSPARVAHAAALDAIIGPAMAARELRDCFEAFEKAGVPAGPINNLERVFADPHVRERGAVVRFDHPDIGAVACLASPMRLSATPVRYDQRPAMLGEHTREVLQERLGLPDQAIEALKAKGTIA